MTAPLRSSVRERPAWELIVGCQRAVHQAIHGDRGSMTVVAAWVIAALLAVTTAVLLYAHVVIAAHQIRAVADMAAVSGALAQRQGEPGCSEAQRIGQLHAIDTLECRLDGQDVVVHVEKAVHAGVLGDHPISAVARAGPS